MLSIPINSELQQVSDIVFSEPSPPRHFKWLHNGIVYPIRAERRAGRVYWYMRKFVNGQLHNIYVAPAGKLTAALLNAAATQIAANASPVKP